MSDITKIRYVNTKWVMSHFGVHRQTVYYWRQHRCLVSEERPMEGEFGTRREVIFNYKSLMKWAKENNIEKAK